MPIIKTQVKTLYPQHEETILEALERSGHQVEYQCRQGYCGHCRLKIAQGEVEYPFWPLAYIRPGEILACCAVPKTDIELEFVPLRQQEPITAE